MICARRGRRVDEVGGLAGGELLAGLLELEHGVAASVTMRGRSFTAASPSSLSKPALLVSGSTSWVPSWRSRSCQSQSSGQS